MSELARRRCLVGVKTVVPPILPFHELEWASEAFGTAKKIVILSPKDELHFQQSTMAPWNIAFRGPGESGEQFVPGGLGACIHFWDTVVLKDHPYVVIGCKRGYVKV